MTVSSTTPPSGGGHFSSLPADTLGRVIPFLDDPSLSAFVLTSKPLSQVVVIQTGATKATELRLFIEKVCSQLNGELYEEHKAALNTIKSLISSSFPNLRSLKEHITTIRTELVDILFSLKDEDFIAFKDVGVLIDISRFFAESGDIEAAARIAFLAPQGNDRLMELYDFIARMMLKKNGSSGK